MIRLERLNVVVEVDSEAKAELLIAEGFKRIDAVDTDDAVDTTNTEETVEIAKRSKGKKSSKNKEEAADENIVSVDDLMAGEENAGDGK